ncbi:MAG TPA: hypothetical protein VL382_01525, partial [Terriglobales bacterium]|nr:hypothetical protein [Terriglobales bacterium]
MTAAEHPALHHRRRIVRAALIGFALLAIIITAGLYLTSNSFQSTVRKRLVAELERVTGARVEIRHFRWNVSKLEVEADDVTLHGLEGPEDVPYAHADRLYARAKILSFFGREIGLRAVSVEHPVIHIIVFPDGSTNQPVPKIKLESHRSAVDRLFDLAIDKAEIVDGQLLLNDRRIPFDFSGNDVSAHMSYTLLARRYDGQVKVGQMDSKYRDFQPLRSKAELEFSLAPTGAEIKQLSWESAKSKVVASGRMTNFNDPRIDATYEVSIDLAELGAVSRTPQLRAGTFTANGRGTYTVAEFTTAGHALLQNVTWIEEGRTVPSLNAAASYSASRERFSISDLRGAVFGGRVSGSADVMHWFSPVEWTGAKTKPTAGQPQQGSATVQLSGVSLGQLVAALSTARMPMQRVQPVGSVDGTINLKWTGTARAAETAIALDVTPPSNPRPDQVPVTARVRAAYFGGPEVLRVDELSMATRATRLNAAGALGSTTGRLNVALNTNDLSEFRPALLALRHPGPLPVDIRGRASFTGR